jgi:ATP-binding cassette subfamily A (ABC1) protein 3
LVSGVSVPAYWFSNLAIDLLKYYFPTCIFCILMIEAFNIEAFNEDSDSYTAIALLFILYGWAIIPFSYVFGFLFKAYGNA